LMLHRISMKWQPNQCEQRARIRSTKKTIQQRSSTTYRPSR
jgi:hypothetical protein